MQKFVDKLYKDRGTPVYVRFGNTLQVVLLNIKDSQEELKEIWGEHLKGGSSGVFELPINHGIACNCCSKFVHESYTRPTIAESKRAKLPGRPGIKRFVLDG